MREGVGVPHLEEEAGVVGQEGYQLIVQLFGLDFLHIEVASLAYRPVSQ